MDQALYEAGYIMYSSLNNNSKKATCLIKLGKFQEALDSATKADTCKTWKELCIACMAVGEFKLAGIAGQNVIVHHDNLDELITTYEKYG
jgi:clathrin heavy chain